MKKIISFILITFISVFADGVIIPPQNQEIYSTDQIAVIKHFEGVEELTLLVKTNYIYQSVVWIIPLLSSPQVSEVNTDLFLDLAEITKPVYPYRPGYDFNCDGYYGPEEGRRGEDYFIIESAKIFGFLSTVVINTNQADSLKQWLLNNGYSFNDTVAELFQEYINNNWNYFFCARTTDTVQYNRNALGVKLVFNSEKPVFPLKISRVNYYYNGYGYYPGLFLYIISAHKMTFPKSDLLYANRVNEAELKKIKEDFPELGGYLNQDNYLTKLFKEFTSASEMDDITLTQAKDDKEYRELYGRYYNYYGMNIPIFPFGLFLYLLILGLYYFIKKRRKLKI